jgi:hypothetical protein
LPSTPEKGVSGNINLLILVLLLFTICFCLFVGFTYVKKQIYVIPGIEEMMEPRIYK